MNRRRHGRLTTAVLLVLSGGVGLLVGCGGGETPNRSGTTPPGTAPTITSTPSAVATVGQVYSYVVTAVGNPAPAISASGLPGWLQCTGSLLEGTPGTADVGLTGSITVTATNGVAPDASQFFRLQVASPGPFSRSSHTVGSGPTGVAIGDLDGDGRLDITVANGGSDDVSLLYQTASGGFVESRMAVPDVSAVATGDLNHDGRADLVCASAVAGELRIYAQNPQGDLVQIGLNPYVIVPTTVGVCLGDVNDDGRQDLVAASSDPAGGSLSVYHQDASGALTPMAGSPMFMGPSASALALGDWSDDGRTDAAVVYAASPGYLAMYPQNVQGQLVPAAAAWSVGTDPSAMAAGDLNGDGRADLAIANAGSNDVTVYLQRAGGGLTQPTTPSLAVGTAPSAIAVADLNGDGRADLAVTNSRSNDLTLYLQDVHGSLYESTTSPYPTGQSPAHLATGDLDGDGRTDLVVANRGSDDATVYLQQ
ncbi:FG-GAP-like repeat-containing protein [Planctomycetota bacterium]